MNGGQLVKHGVKYVYCTTTRIDRRTLNTSLANPRPTGRLAMCGDFTCGSSGRDHRGSFGREIGNQLGRLSAAL